MPAEQKAPSEKTAMRTSMAPPVENDPGKVYLIRENPFYWLHIEKSVEHARNAEIAGNRGEILELRTHAEMSLLQAKEAQRAGNVAGLNEGIANLKKALETQASTQAQASSQGVELSGTAREEAVLRSSTDFVREARKNLSQAGGMKYKEIQPQVAVSTER